jgi:nitroreductase
MIDLLRQRRSIRKFQNKKIPGKIIDILKEAILRSPSSRGINPWEFIFVTDSNILNNISKAKSHGSQFLSNTALSVVVLADETKTDVWVEDCSIASIILQLTAESLGLRSCWVQIRNRMHNDTETAENYLKNLLNIPRQYKILSVIGIGYPDEEKKPHDDNYPDYSKIHLNEF